MDPPGTPHTGAPTLPVTGVQINVANSTEFAGACFSPDGRILFVNIMGSTTDAGRDVGMTLAIRGPWEQGAL